MTVVIDGTTGIDTIADNTVTSAKIMNGAVLPVDTQVGALPSMVRLNTANGYGSTNTKIRRFTNVVTNQGTDITYADSATLGASFTINTNGVYAISYSDTFSSTLTLGLSLNTSSPTTSIYLLPVAEILSVSINAFAAYGGHVSAALYLPSGSVVRAHTEGGVTGANPNQCQFVITRVA